MSSQARREQVALCQARGHILRRACKQLGISRSGLRYQPVRTSRDATVLGAMQRLSAQYPRYGYRRICIFLAREGHPMGPKRAYRL